MGLSKLFIEAEETKAFGWSWLVTMDGQPFLQQSERQCACNKTINV